MKRNILAGSLYLFITLVVMFSWFHYGLMYGGGDVGLPTYNPQRVLQLASQPWWTETAPGFPRPQNLAALPAYVFFAFLQQIGLPPFMIQAIVFGILLFLMGFGMYLIAEHILKGENRRIALLAGFYYMVNPYMMVLVWHRFTYTTFFFAASLPLLLLLWRKWIREKRFTNLILFILINLAFSYMFTTLAYVITLWFLLGVYSLFEAVFPWTGWKKTVTISASFILGLVLWILTNTWWILPMFFVLPSLTSEQHLVGDTLMTLIAIGKQSIIPYSLPGLNSFYLFQRQELGEVFKHPLFLFIPWLGVFFIMMGAYFTKKNRELIFWSMLFISVIFLAKGAAPPLGYFYPYLFEKFFFLGILRNPFEKFGLLIPFSGSILFAIGFFNLASFFWKRNILAGKAIIILSFGLFFGIYHWPFWTGTLFGTLERRNFVEVPQYYQQANQWISDQKKVGNILHLPLSTGDSSVYRWQYGYSGLDSNVAFFTSNPSISMGFNLSYLDDALQGFNLMASFDQIKYRQNLKELFRAFNVRFIVLHKDIDWQASVVQSPEKIEKILDMLPFLKKQKEIGELTIYEMDESSFLSKIYLSSYSNNAIFGKNYNSWFLFLKSSPDSFLSGISGSDQISDTSDGGEKLVFPQAVIKIYNSNLENALAELPAVRFLPDSPFYSLILFKEFIQQRSFQLPGESLVLGFAGKRLTEAYKMLDQNPNFQISGLMKAYIVYLNKAVIDKLGSGIIQRASDEFGSLKQILARHQIILEKINEKAGRENKTKASEALLILRQKMQEMNMQTTYELITKKELDSGQLAYRFSVPVDGEYEILMAGSKVAPLYQKNLSQLDLQIDNIAQTRNSQIKDDFISYGNIPLKVGQHEFSFNIQNSVNLIKNKQEEIKIISQQYNPTQYDFQVEPFNPNSTYVLSFDYWTQLGNDPIIQIQQDSDPENYLATDALFKQKTHQFIEQIKLDKYNKFWKTYYASISPRNNSMKFSLQIVSAPWNNCRYLLPKKICDKPEMQFNFLNPSTVVIRNIQIFRILDNPLFLRKIATNQTSQIVSLNYTKKAPLEYEGNIVLDKPSYLIFSETFNNNWELTLFDNNEQYEISKHFFANMYGNGWFIDKIGSYKFRITFSAYKYLIRSHEKSN